MSNMEIKPCPFCGHTPIDKMDFLHPTGICWRDDPEVGRHYVAANDPRGFHGRCWELGCLGHEGGCGATMHGDSQEDVVAKWNRRPQPNIRVMVDRFLGWKLPQSMCPDGGLSFKRPTPDAMGYMPSWPIGTNLFAATEATEMFEYCLDAVSEPWVFAQKKDQLFRIWNGVPLEEVQEAYRLYEKHIQPND